MKTVLLYMKLHVTFTKNTLQGPKAGVIKSSSVKAQ